MPCTELKIYLFYISIIICISLVIVFIYTKEIINEILNSNIVRSYIAGKINRIKNNIELENKKIDISYATSIYDIQIETSDLEENDISIEFQSLNDVLIYLKYIRGCVSFKTLTGPSEKISVGSSFTVCFELKNFFYESNIIYYPLNINCIDEKYNLKLDIDNNRYLIKWLAKVGIYLFEQKISNYIYYYLKEIPKKFRKNIKATEKENERIFYGIQLYTSAHYEFIFFLNDIKFRLFLYYIYLKNKFNLK